MDDSLLCTHGDDTVAVDRLEPAPEATHGIRVDELEWWGLWRELRAARFARQHWENAAAWTRSSSRREQCQREADSARQYAGLVRVELQKARQPADRCPRLRADQQVWPADGAVVERASGRGPQSARAHAEPQRAEPQPES